MQRDQLNACLNSKGEPFVLVLLDHFVMQVLLCALAGKVF